VRTARRPGWRGAVPAFIRSVSVDCADALLLARFWAAALGSDVDEVSTADKAFVDVDVRPSWPGHGLQLTLEEDPMLLESLRDLGSLVRRPIEEAPRPIQSLRGRHETARVQPDDPRPSHNGFAEQLVE
jgi:hypothetical protein